MDTRSRVPFNIVLLALLAALVSPLAASALPHFQTFETVHIDPPQAAGGGGDDLSAIIPLLLLFHDQPGPDAIALKVEFRGSGAIPRSGVGRFAGCDRLPAGSEGWSWGKKSRSRVHPERDGARPIEVFAEGSAICRIGLVVPAAVIADWEEAAGAERRRRSRPRQIVVVGSQAATPGR